MYPLYVLARKPEAHLEARLRQRRDGAHDKNIFPSLGTRPIGEITPAELLAVLRRIETRGAVDQAHRVRSICSLIFRYAIATGRAGREHEVRVP